MPVPMLDLRAQYAVIKDEVEAAVQAVLESQTFRGGPNTVAFERELAAYAEVKHALGVSTGTDAVLLLLKAAGIQPGDEVITTPFTFFATAGAIVNAGATPVFADITPGTFNIDPESVARLIGPRTRALMPVHIFGQPAPMEELRAMAEAHGLLLLEDCAQALGARYHGTRVGGIGLGGAVSFYPTKNLGSAGEGGAILTNDDAVAEQVKLWRCHGSPAQYEHVLVGTNSHLHEMQAALLRIKLRRLDAWNAARRACAERYDALFAEMPEVGRPESIGDIVHVWHQYVIRVPQRDSCTALLRERGIGHGVFYPKSLHQQTCFEGKMKAGPCPESERACREVIALPIYPELTGEQQAEVAGVIAEHLARA